MLKKRFAAGLVLLMVVMVLTGCAPQPKRLNAGQMLSAEIDLSQRMGPLMHDMADSYGAYLAFSKTEGQFARDLAGFQKRYQELSAQFDDLHRRYRVDEATMTPEIRTAMSQLKDARACVQTILTQTMTDEKVIGRSEAMTIYLTETQKMNALLEQFRSVGL